MKMLVATRHQIGQSQMLQANTKFLLVACSILQDLMAEMSTLRTFEKVYLSRTASQKPGYFHRVDPSPRSVECTDNSPHSQERTGRTNVLVLHDRELVPACSLFK